MDRYDSYSALTKEQQEGCDFRVVLRAGRDRSTILIAPHGGGIEAGTSEVAGAVAGDDFSFAAFEGLKKAGNRDLHITRERLNKSRAGALVGSVECVATS